MLGQLADAEDVVQEAWLRWARAAPAGVQDARAYLVRVTTRLALDRLRRLKARREAYVGPWLPEPLLTGPRAPVGDDPAADAERAESVSLALLVVLETLSPLERAVFVLPTPRSPPPSAAARQPCASWPAGRATTSGRGAPGSTPTRTRGAG
jgi:RNA polymerase sigma-70 factor (ECF subfamily)